MAPLLQSARLGPKPQGRTINQLGSFRKNPAGNIDPAPVALVAMESLGETVKLISLLIAAALPLSAQITINTFAGGVVRSGVPAQNVYLDARNGLAWDANGNVVFTDTTNNAIRRVNTSGTLETIAGMGAPGFTGDDGPATAALVNKPAAPHYDAAGNLYFLDSGNLRIRRIDPKGIVTTVAGDGIPFNAGMDSTGPALQRSLDYISDVQVSASGNVYFLEPSQNRIRAVTPDGQVRIFFTLSQSLFSSPTMTIDGAGNLYVSENDTYYYAAILRIAPDGTSTVLYQVTTTGEHFASVPSVTADPAGNLYYVATGAFSGGAIVLFNPANGSTTAIAGGGQPPNYGYVSSPDGPALPSVIYPSNLAFDAHGNIVFYDNFTPAVCCNSRIEIREATAASQLVTLAGADGQFAPDGTPLGSIWFEGLQSIAFSQNGDLYIAESGACKIHKITAAGAFTTFAGNGTCAYPSPSPNAQNAAITPVVSIAVDQQNRVWVADGYVDLYYIAQDGTVSQVIKTPVEGGTGKIAVDSKGRVDVIGLDSLYRVLPDLTYQALFPPPSNGGTGPPWNFTGIAADASGTVYVVANFNLYTINDDGTLSLVDQNVGSLGSIAVGPKEQIWEGGAGIYIYGSAALGDARAVTPGDGGPVNSAGIDQASWLAFSPAGDLYFVDGNRIRRLIGIGNATPVPAINAGGIVNSASYVGGAVAPGELISIFGSNFGTTGLETAAVENNYYPTGLGRTQVLFNGYPGTILAVTPTQINAIVPQYGTSTTSTTIQVEVDATPSLPVTLPLAAAAPALSTANLSGSGPAAIVNQDGSINSASNPAPRGSVVSLYGTGLGTLFFPLEVYGYFPSLPDGALTISTPYPMPQAPVTVTIGGQPATVSYAGAAPFLVNGAFQINVQIPTGIPPGAAAIVVSAGGIASTQQVTVSVQ